MVGTLALCSTVILTAVLLLNVAANVEGNSQQCSYVTIPVCENNVTVTPRGVANSGCKRGDVGPPGKAGPAGVKGERGVKGDAGQKGEPGDYESFEEEVQEKLKSEKTSISLCFFDNFKSILNISIVIRVLGKEKLFKTLFKCT